MIFALVSATPSIWSTLLPVLIGGFIAILGSVAAQLAASHLKNKSDYQNHQRDKLETLIQLVNEAQILVAEQTVKSLQKGENEELIPPLGQATAIAVMYFPQLLPELNAFQNAILEAVQWTVNATAKVKLGTIREINHEEASKHQQTIGSALSKLHKKAREMMNERYPHKPANKPT